MDVSMNIYIRASLGCNVLSYLLRMGLPYGLGEHLL